jgi:IS5 family transposase
MDPRHFSGKPALSQRQDFPLLEHLNLHHPLIVLAKLIDWNAIDQVAYEAMGPRHRRPPLRPRLVAGLLYLQHTFDLSDEEVVWGWVENPYIWTVAGEQPLFL